MKTVKKLAGIGKNVVVIAAAIIAAIVLFGFVFPWLVSAKSGVAGATGVCLLIRAVQRNGQFQQSARPYAC